MPKSRVENKVSPIAIEKLVAHPDNPNRMSKRNFARLVRNIERTGRYEPLVVRPCPRKAGFFQIINGHQRCQALQELGYKTVDVIVWDVNDRDADMLFATMNRLGGSDVLEKKLALLSRLSKQRQTGDLAKLLPATRRQIERLSKQKQAGDLAKLLPATRRQIERLSRLKISNCRTAIEKCNSQIRAGKSKFANPLVFFVNDEQKEIIENALTVAREARGGKTKAARNAAALAFIAQHLNLKS
ncbi:MAG: ParB/RepB/Spo0J family partition protein [Planctomycetota bacterium]|jgi:ParB/RepB/Spo0J family partition protein